MSAQRKDGLETRQRLLEPASEVFAQKGFRDATIAEICREAGANVAAVNYHFGSKGELYVEAWRHAFEESTRAHPPDGGVAADAPPEERLRGRILSMMRRIADPKSHEFEIVHKEMASPTGLLTQAMRELIEASQRGLSAVVRELLGAGAAEQQVRLCQMSIKAQCFGPMLRERRRKRSPEALPPAGPDLLDADVEVLADHVTRFSLAGIAEVRRGNARDEHPGGVR